MPTKKKRVGFIPRVDVMKLINKLSIENNLSNSNIVSILVEEALSMRGIFNKKKGKINPSYQLIEDHEQNLASTSPNFIDNQKLTIDTDSGDNINASNSNNLKEANQESFDLNTYKRFLLFLKFQEMMDKYDT